MNRHGLPPEPGSLTEEQINLLTDTDLKEEFKRVMATGCRYFTERDAMVYTKCKLEGYPLGEMANSLQLSQSAVRSIIQKVERQLFYNFRYGYYFGGFCSSSDKSRFELSEVFYAMQRREPVAYSTIVGAKYIMSVLDSLKHPSS